MARALVSALITAAAFVAAIAMNPSPEAHRDKIRQVTAERNPVAGALGFGALKAFASNYHSLGVASYTTANGRVVSWGLFGIVFVADTPPSGK